MQLIASCAPAFFVGGYLWGSSGLRHATVMSFWLET